MLVQVTRVNAAELVGIRCSEKVASHLVKRLIADPKASVGHVNVVAKADTTLLQVVAHSIPESRLLGLMDIQV